MISFEDFRMEPGTPIYHQILTHIKRGIVAGTVRDGDEFPSRRVLSALLGVNPNTVQKACRLLEEEGLLHSHTGAKSCMILPEDRVRAIRQELITEDARAAVEKLKQMGLSKEEVFDLIETYWDGGVRE